MPQASALVSDRIQIGMSREVVIDYLGTPQRIEKYGTTEFFFYNPHWTVAIGAIGRLPIAIADGKVVAFGKSYYEDFKKREGKT